MSWVNFELTKNILRPWNDETLGKAYSVLLEELDLPPSAPGGKVEFRRSLTLSFLFRFNLEVLQKFREMVGDMGSSSAVRSSQENLTKFFLVFFPEHHRQNS